MLKGWETALTGVPDASLSAVWEAARNEWNWAKNSYLPPWFLQAKAKDFVITPTRQSSAAQELWDERAREMELHAEFETRLAQMTVDAIEAERAAEGAKVTIWAQTLRRYPAAEYWEPDVRDKTIRATRAAELLAAIQTRYRKYLKDGGELGFAEWTRSRDGGER